MVFIRKKKKMSEEQRLAEKNEKELQKAGIQDQFQAKGFELVEFVQTHKQYITIGLSACALALVLWAGLSHFRKGAELKASADFEAALSLYDKSVDSSDDKAKGLRADALGAFQKITSTQGGSSVGRLALLYIGHLSLLNNEPKKAIDAYGAYVEKTGRNDEMRSLGVVGLANAYEANNEPKKALERYESLLEGGVNVDEAMVLWQAARLAKLTGQDKKAQDLNAKLATKYPTANMLGSNAVMPAIE